MAAGAVLGYAARQRPRPGVVIAATAPLWGLLLGAFGVAPVLQRSEQPLPDVAPNLGGFALAASLLYLTPILGAPPPLPGARDREGDDGGA